LHVPDGFINAPVSAAAAGLAFGALGLAVRRSRAELDDRTAPLAGLVAVFVFSAQMINFPVAAGTSGHLIGGALAAILVGPWAGALALAVVLLMQALLFADGGLSALGLNMINMAFVTTFVGWLVFRGMTRFLPQRREYWLAAAFAAGLLSVPVSAAAFAVEYGIGGVGTFQFASVLLAMVGTHLVIGVGEAAITALVIGALLTSRPDLVAGLRGRVPSPRLVPRTPVPQVS
jgi:cobalt/nickel transport system permease protein